VCVCMYVCVCEREREREGEGGWGCVCTCVCMCVCTRAYVCVFVLCALYMHALYEAEKTAKLIVNLLSVQKCKKYVANNTNSSSNGTPGCSQHTRKLKKFLNINQHTGGTDGRSMK